MTNLQEGTDDILTEVGVIKDDNSKIIKSHDGSRVYFDKENPRTEIWILPFKERFKKLNKEWKKMEKDINKKIAEELGRKVDEINEIIEAGEKFIVNAKGESTKKIGTVLWDTAKAYGILEGMEMTAEVFRKHTGAKKEWNNY